ncbi:hypothetical protein B0H17DRAFT_1148158 [Mycena rosella]|uniref:Uncharacterized protein n=1 Tax=Mycena rosella TaxID=1033263 RepID=A0AAD7CDZ9_MYCRO|nr:hypothetical protein B0H17DRAFT_1148158 [Mycena rosella]
MTSNCPHRNIRAALSPGLALVPLVNCRLHPYFMSLSEASGNNMSGMQPLLSGTYPDSNGEGSFLLSPPRHFPAPLAGETRTLPSLKNCDAAAFQASLSRLKEACGQEYIPAVERKLATKPPKLNSIEAFKVQESKYMSEKSKTADAAVIGPARPDKPVREKKPYQV